MGYSIIEIKFTGDDCVNSKTLITRGDFTMETNMTQERINRSLHETYLNSDSGEEKLNQIRFVIHHNLRGPLCSIQSLLQCLDMKSLSPDQIQILDWISQKCEEIDEASVMLGQLADK